MLKEYSETVPIQYETGKARFMEMDIAVDPRVLIPRPETELLVRTAVALCQDKALVRPKVLEVGTGSGIIPIGITRLLPEAEIVSVDISEAALDVAAANIKKFGADKIKLIKSDMFTSLNSDMEGVFDLVVSNPPYVSDADYAKVDAWVKAEPEIALRSGAEGMDHINIIAGESGRFLKPGGIVALEIGYDQAGKTKRVFSKEGFEDIKSFFDMNGYERVITGYWNG